MIGVESVVGRGTTPPPARSEHDFLGQRPIPAGAYWGVHTARALENFTASGTPVSVHPTLVAGLGAVKLAAVRANRELELIDARRAEVIERACQEVREGLFDDQFVVDVLQGGAGTSTNMNANEVIANRALELLGLPAGSYHEVHPLDHVNRSQSTNDVYPTALKLGLLAALDGLSVVRAAGQVPSSGRCRRWGAPSSRTPSHDRRQARLPRPFSRRSPASATRVPSSVRSTWEGQRSAPASPRTRPTGKRSAATSARSPVCRWSALSTWSRRPPTPGCSSSSQESSSAPQ